MDRSLIDVVGNKHEKQGKTGFELIARISRSRRGRGEQATGTTSRKHAQQAYKTYRQVNRHTFLNHSTASAGNPSPLICPTNSSLIFANTSSNFARLAALSDILVTVTSASFWFCKRFALSAAMGVVGKGRGVVVDEIAIGA